MSKNISKHIGLINRDHKGCIKEVRYFESKFNREIGDAMIFEGKKITVEIIGLSKNDVIRKCNELIKMQNKIVRSINNKNRASSKLEGEKLMYKIFSEISDESGMTVSEIMRVFKGLKN